MRVLVLCHANRWRSPLAAGFLTQCSKHQVRSAGFRSDPGRQAGKPVRKVARQFNLDLSAHRSTVVSQELLDWAHVVVVMNAVQLAKLKTFSLSGQRLVRLGEFARPPVASIPDLAFINQHSPEFMRVVRMILQATQHLAVRFE